MQHTKRNNTMVYTAKHALKRWLPAILWMAVIFWFSSQPQLPRPDSDLLNLIFKKAAHFGTYGVLALLYWRALGSRQRRRYALALAVLYAITDEFHQAWTPLRNPSPVDVLIDTAGAATALWGLLPIYGRFKHRAGQRTATNGASAGGESRGNINIP